MWYWVQSSWPRPHRSGKAGTAAGQGFSIMEQSSEYQEVSQTFEEREKTTYPAGSKNIYLHIVHNYSVGEKGILGDEQGLFKRCTQNGDSNLFNASI